MPSKHQSSSRVHFIQWAEAGPSNEPPAIGRDAPPVEPAARPLGWFCDKWAAIAGAMGWQPADLLGWDPRRPNTPDRKDSWNHIIWKLDGSAVVEITRDAL